MKLKLFSLSILASVNTVVLFTVVTLTSSAKAQKLEVQDYHIVEPFMNKYCISCHGPDKQKGKFRIDTMGKYIDSQNEAEYWQEMLDLINFGEMPPPPDEDDPDIPQPTKEELKQILEALYKTTSNVHDIMTKMKSGKMRRMNRREYVNTVEDRLGIRPKELLLPVDPGDFGFDTFREELVVTPTQIEGYMLAGKDVVSRLMASIKNPDEMGDLQSYIFGDLSAYMEEVAKTVKTQKNAAKFETILSDPPDSEARPIFKRYVSLLYQGRDISGALISNMEMVFRVGRESGMTFWQALVDPMVVALTSPNFIYLIEKQQTLTQEEIANRIALLLWGAASPDDELLNLARSNQLLQPRNLADQVLRMLQDDKAERFYNSFIDQWLELDRLDLVVVDDVLFPDVAEYQTLIKKSMREQVRSYVRELMITNSPARLLAASDFTMVDPGLAQYYGLEYPGNPNKDGFKKIQLQGRDQLRSGILGTGAVQMLTSTGMRTSPVERGVYILRKLLDRSPPPAPADVPEIEDELVGEKSTKELLAHHSTTVQCAACHDRIDPLGFGMESFGPMGRLQLYENQHAKELTKKIPVDTEGRMPNGNTFGSFVELQKLLVEQEEQIARTYVKALMSYALGRPVGFADRKEIDDIIEKTRGRNFQLAELTYQVCASPQFKIKN